MVCNRAAEHAHHRHYPESGKDADNTADMLTSLCERCHFLFHEMDRHLRTGGSFFVFKALVRKGIAQCCTESRSEGLRPLIMHSATGLDPSLPANIEKKEITAKKGANRTEADNARLRELETLTAFWLDSYDRLVIPPAAFRSCVEKAARKLRQGPQVREGLIVTKCVEFHYDVKKYGKELSKLSRTTQFTVPVVVQRARILRTRALFEEWRGTFEVETDPELVDQEQLEAWLDIAGRRVGLGDWRPEKSGHYGRFVAESVEVV